MPFIMKQITIFPFILLHGMSKKYNWLFLVALWFSTNLAASAQANTSEIKSSHAEEMAKVDALLMLAQKHQNEKQKFLQYNFDALQLAEKIHYQKGIEQSLQLLQNNYPQHKHFLSNYTLPTPLWIIAGLMIILPISFLYRRYHDKNKSNKILQEINTYVNAQNEALLESEKSLKQINATKDKFFSIISHDIKGPLNSITGFLEVLIQHADGFSRDELKTFAGNMNKAIGSLKDLLENLLQWSRSQGNNIQYKPELIDLKIVVDEIYQLLTTIAENKDLKLVGELQEGLQVYADKNMLHFILRNLIGNAIKFTPKGGEIITQVKDLGNFQEIKVIDSGVGMTQEELINVFKLESYQIKKGTENEIGTGLGLMLCNEFVERNGGSITIQSKINQGSVFTFTLPKSDQFHDNLS